MGDGQAERGFQSGDSEHGALELDDLFMRRMGSVIGGDGIDGAIGESHENRFAIGARTQRRIHLEVGVVVADIGVGQS